MTVNQFQQNISIKLTDDYLNLSTLLTGNVMKFSVDITKIFNSVQCLCYGSRNTSLICVCNKLIRKENAVLMFKKLDIEKLSSISIQFSFFSNIVL